jgi:hypothetical protein
LEILRKDVGEVENGVFDTRGGRLLSITVDVLPLPEISGRWKRWPHNVWRIGIAPEKLKVIWNQPRPARPGVGTVSAHDIGRA